MTDSQVEKIVEMGLSPGGVLPVLSAERRKLLYRHRFCKVVSLEIMTPHSGEEAVLILCLNAFRQSLYSQITGHTDHILQDLFRLSFVLRPVQEYHIDLQNIDRDVFEHIQ